MKFFFGKLAQPLLDVFAEAEHRNTPRLPRSQRLAYVNFFYKDKGDPAKCNNYRPLSLLASEYRAFTKAYAIRLSSIIGTLVDSGQTAAIPGRAEVDGELLDGLALAGRTEDAPRLVHGPRREDGRAVDRERADAAAAGLRRQEQAVGGDE